MFQALIEERKLYCFCVDHFCSVLQNQIAYNAAVSILIYVMSMEDLNFQSQSHRVLSTRVNEWSGLCSSPDELPAESAALLSVCSFIVQYISEAGTILIILLVEACEMHGFISNANYSYFRILGQLEPFLLQPTIPEVKQYPKMTYNVVVVVVVAGSMLAQALQMGPTSQQRRMRYM